ncbi:ABC transporter permease [Alicyclobacillaceae bacterium I2511]|nr:ABC transporter permease [Alicyclobacillaceae bacterium I2511]
MAELWRVMVNEWMKLVRRRRFWVAGGLLLCVVALFGLIGYHQHRQELNYNPVQTQQAQIAGMRGQLQILKKGPQTKATQAQEAQLMQGLKGLSTGPDAVAVYTAANWRPLVQQQVDLLQSQVANVRQQLASATGQNWMSLQIQYNSVASQLLVQQYSLAHNVRPSAYWHTSAYQAMGNFLDVVNRLFLPLLVILLVADMVSGETTAGTIKLLLVRPVPRWKILLGKGWVSLAGTVALTVALWGLLWLAGILVYGGAAGARQPVITGLTYTFRQIVLSGQPVQSVPVAQFATAHVLSQWQYLLLGGVWTVIAMAVVASLTLFCSVVFKSTMASMAVPMGAVVIGQIITQIGARQTWSGWLFPTQLNLLANWTGQQAVQTQQNMTLSFGIAVLLIWGGIALAIAFWQFSRQDVLNA